MKQAEEIGQGEATSYILESTNSFRNIIIDNAEVWRRGCMGEELSDGDQTRFANIHRYPGIAKLGLSKQYWGTEGSKVDLIGIERFTAAFEARLTKLREIEPEPLSNPDWCGSLS